MTGCISDSKNSNQGTLTADNPFSKVSGYKNNSPKSVAFLYTNVKLDEQEIRKFLSQSKIPSVNSNQASKRMTSIIKSLSLEKKK